MKAGQTKAVLVKPGTTKLTIEGIHEHDQNLEDYGWFEVGKMIRCVNSLYRDICSNESDVSPIGTSTEFFERYGWLNDHHEGEYFVTWVAKFPDYTEYVVRGAPPKTFGIEVNYLLEAPATVELYIPSGWGLKVFDQIYRNRIVKVISRRLRNRCHTLTAETPEGRKCDIVRRGNYPNYQYYVSSEMAE